MATNAQLNFPYSVFVTQNNEVYIADAHNHVIRKILRSGDIVTIAGTGKQGYSGDNGPATSAQLYYPSSVFVSCNNEVYISDSHNNRIRKILQNGNIVTIAGNGEFGCSGDDGPAISAQLYKPSCIFVSPNNEVYIADQYHQRIRKILTNGNIVTIAGNGQKGYSGDNGPATSAELNCPYGVFVSSNNEVYIADRGNHRIRKILTNGNIVTIAGNGESGYSGDSGPATNTRLYNPSSVFVSSNNAVYISDTNNNRIRKILRNGNIVTIAGNGEFGCSGDNGPATNAKLNPFTVFVSSNNEVYIVDQSNQRIRKILTNGNIVTIAGNGQKGYSGDSPFDFSLHPHIGGPVYTQSNSIIKLKKHSRDLLFKSSIIAFIPLIEKLSPLFCKIVLKNETFISSLNSMQQEIVQKLIDSLIYNPDESELKFNSDETLNALFILGLFKNDEFIELKKILTSQFIESLTVHNLALKWEEIDSYLSQFSNQLQLQNYILEYLNNYCVEFAAIQMKTLEGFKELSALAIITRNNTDILSKNSLTRPTPIIIIEKMEILQMNIETLYNDNKTSDLKIEIGQNKYLYCHRTVLISSSSFFDAMFNSGSTFSDLKNDTFTVDSSDDLEFLEIIIKSCYGIPVDNVPSERIIYLLDMAMKHEMEGIVKYCKNNLTITIENYFDILSACEPYFELEVFESFYNELLQFSIQNRKQLFQDDNKILKLPQKLWVGIFKTLCKDF